MQVILSTYTSLISKLLPLSSSLLLSSLLLSSLLLSSPNNYLVPPTQVDMPGSDYRGVAIPSPDPEICQTLCYSDFACRAWTFTPSGILPYREK
jgi:PAN domain